MEMGAVRDYQQLKNWTGYRLFLTATDFVRAATEYFQWVDEHPLLEDVVAFYQGDECRADRSRMRPYTKQGLATHLNIPVSRIDSYKKKGGEWADVVDIIETVLYQQKFEGAAAGLLNATIIARDLGLAERSEVSGPDGGPIKTSQALNLSKLSDDAMAELLDAWDSEADDATAG